MSSEVIKRDENTEKTRRERERERMKQKVKIPGIKIEN